MFLRVVSGVVLALAAVALLVFDVLAVRLGAVLVLMLVSQHEMLTALRSAGWKPYAWPGYVYTIAMIPLGYGMNRDASTLLFVALLMAIFCWFVLRSGRQQNPDITEAFVSAVPLLYPLVFFQILFQAVILPSPHWRTILLGGVGAACLTDTFALFGGLLFGKHKLAPQISPKKTWEGALSGFIGGTAGGALLFALQGLWGGGLPLWVYLVGAALSSIAGQLGDLTASSIKRRTGIKDFGKIIPGHGGVLDRLDSILFAVPVFYFFVTIYAGI
jgi:CDP-diglyceride synthetase